MARIRKRGASWTAEVRRIGYEPASAAFPTKAEAQAWAAEVERQIRSGKSPITRNTLADLLDEYLRKVTPTKRGRAWEERRIAWMLQQPFSRLMLADLTPKALADWRDARLSEASGETVRRDFNLLSHALNVAIREWGWLHENPCKRVSRPAGNPARERIATDDEIARICHAAGYVIGQIAETATSRTGAAFVFSVETGMRAGEIVGLTHPGGPVAVLPRTKNGDRREVPLSEAAQQVLRDVGGNFGLTGPQRDALWRKIVKRAGIEGLHFHDARATAITRLSKKLDVLALARMVGHRDIRMLQRYYRPSAEDIAKLL